MKRLIALSLALLILFSFAGCKAKEVDPATAAGKNGDRVNYNYDMADYVTLGTYKGIEVDKSSEEYQNNYKSNFESLVSSADAYEYVTEGTLAENDTAMIEYVGRIDGEEFDGGSSTEEYPLTLGSGAFIPGFEDAPIGKPVGEESVINVTFPEDYGVDTLNGKEAEFTVMVNSVRKLPEINDEIAQKLGYDNYDALHAELEDATIEYCVLNALFTSEDFAVKSYPETEKANYDGLYNELYAAAQSEATAYNTTYGTTVDAETMLYYMYGYTSDNLKYYYQSIQSQEIIMYAIFDAENLSYTEEEYNEFLAEIAEANSTTDEQVTVDDIKEGYASWELEANMIYRVVVKYLLSVAEIK